ncbi:MAG: gliding motility-associated C-terminal domain-containing protein [Bacteroidota bacterium]
MHQLNTQTSRSSKRLLVLLLVLWVIAAYTAMAQDVLPNKVYRVTAYKRGETAVTSQSNHAEVTPQQQIYIPNAFTPNGDGINDRFGVKGEGILNFSMRIFDRWGEVIFESDDPTRTWDGNYLGRPVQQGTYVYQVTSEAMGRRARTGAVTVVR